MSHHIISGQDITTGRAEPINAELNALKIYQDFPSTEIQNIVNSVIIQAGATLSTAEFQFKKRTKILIFGTSNFNNVSIGFEIIPESSSPFTYYETFENIAIVNGAIYSFVNLYTDYFRLKITNNELSPVTVNLFASSKN